VVEVIVTFPEDLHGQANAAAQERGQSLDQFVRGCVRSALHKRADDPFFADISVFQGDAPADLAENHDEYLYGEDS
jgi:hypothetical protein